MRRDLPQGVEVVLLTFFTGRKCLTQIWQHWDGHELLQWWFISSKTCLEGEAMYREYNMTSSDIPGKAARSKLSQILCRSPVASAMLLKKKQFSFTPCMTAIIEQIGSRGERPAWPLRLGSDKGSASR